MILILLSGALILVVSLWLAIVIHELGHVLMCCLLQNPLDHVPLPHFGLLGYRSLEFEVGGTLVAFERSLGGSVNFTRAGRSNFLISLAGPGINLLVAAVAWHIMRTIPLFSIFTMELVFLTFVAHLGSFLICIVPWHPGTDGFQAIAWLCWSAPEAE